MRIVTKKEIENVLKIDENKKYKYFINFICDTQEVWGLYNNGWALAGENNCDHILFPLWPAKEFAEMSASEEWASYQPRSINLEDLIEVLIPQLKEKGLSFSIFYTLENKGIVVSPTELENQVKAELEKYQ